MVRWIHASFAYHWLPGPEATNSLLPLILAHAQMPDDCERGHALDNRTRALILEISACFFFFKLRRGKDALDLVTTNHAVMPSADPVSKPSHCGRGWVCTLV